METEKKEEKKTVKAQEEVSFPVEQIEQTEHKEESAKSFTKEEPEYPSELLAKSESFKQFGLHPDIIRAILSKQSYKITEAKAEVQRYIDSFKA